MTTLTEAKEQAKKHGIHLTKSPPFFVLSFQSLFDKNFKYKTLAEAQAAFSQHVNETNEEVWQAWVATQTIVQTAIQNVQQLEHYVQMHLPKMECGGNFGVTIQLQAIKEMSEAREKWIKQLDELAKYPAARADAMDKLGVLPTVVQTETTTQTHNQVVVLATTTTKTSDDKNQEGGGGDEEKNTTTKVQETKTATSTKPPPLLFYRQQAVVAVDVQYYLLAQGALTSVRNGYLAILDFIEKNQQDLEKPRGSSSHESGYNNMY